MHFCGPWRKYVQRFKKTGIKLYEELQLQSTHCLYIWGQKMTKFTKEKKKTNARILSKAHAHLQTNAGLGGSVGYAVRLETRRSRVQPPTRSATFFRGDWSWNIFYGHSLPSANSRRAVVSFWRKNVHNTDYSLRGLSLPSKRVVR